MRHADIDRELCDAYMSSLHLCLAQPPLWNFPETAQALNSWLEKPAVLPASQLPINAQKNAQRIF